MGEIGVGASTLPQSQAWPHGNFEQRRGVWRELPAPYRFGSQGRFELVPRACERGFVLRKLCARGASMTHPIGGPLPGHHERRKHREKQIFGTPHNQREHDARDQRCHCCDEGQSCGALLGWLCRKVDLGTSRMRIGSVDSRRAVIRELSVVCWSERCRCFVWRRDFQG